MNRLEEELFNAINKEINSNLLLISEYLNGNKNGTINSWIDLGIDENYRILFGNKNLSEQEKVAILSLFKNKIEIVILSILRLLETDLYECSGYNLPFDRKDYEKNNSNWRGSLIKLTDLEGNYLTESLYDDFISYLNRINSDNNKKIE